MEGAGKKKTATDLNFCVTFIYLFVCSLACSCVFVHTDAQVSTHYSTGGEFRHQLPCRSLFPSCFSKNQSSLKEYIKSESAFKCAKVSFTLWANLNHYSCLHTQQSSRECEIDQTWGLIWVLSPGALKTEGKFCLSSEACSLSCKMNLEGFKAYLP